MPAESSSAPESVIAVAEGSRRAAVGDGPAGTGLSAPAAHGAALLTAVLAREPEDFRVDERLGFEPDGTGEHLWLRLEKRLLNTADVVALLERVYAVGSADVGVSGLKDRRAVTCQWFSVRTPRDAAPLERALGAGAGAATTAPVAGPPGAGRRGPGASREADGWDDGTGDGASLSVLTATRHTRKLRRGTHVANAFEITLRDVAMSDGSEAALDARLDALRTIGFPNYLGPQRFGRDGRNVERARAWFRAPRRRVSRQQRGLWLSAARSLLFNRVCAARVADGSWSTLLDGEPVSLDGSRSFFARTDARTDECPDERVAERLRDGDVHPSGPWWGRGEPPARGACATFEDGVLAGLGEFRAGLERAGLEHGRRALRALPRELEHERLASDVSRLRFTLAPGTFATTLLAELGPCSKPEGPGPREGR